MLFNTLARAAGLPSREIEGLIHFRESEFGYHSWNEVVVDGIWKQVDPTWEYLHTPLTSIKFAENSNIYNYEFSFSLKDVQYFSANFELDNH